MTKTRPPLDPQDPLVEPRGARELAQKNAVLAREVQRLEDESAAMRRKLVEAERGSEAAAEMRRAALNLMEDAVEARRAERRELDERRRVEEELRDADRRKDEFLATLAHELRGPLAPVRNSLSVLRLPDTDAATMERLHAVIERQVAHMARLVEDLMEVSRITRGRVDLRRQRVSLASIVDAGVETSRPSIAAAGHVLEVSLPSESLWLDVDPLRIAQVLSNLLHNAAKYTNDGGRISLTAFEKPGAVEITIRDNGVGIPPEMLGHVFDLFAQAQETADRAQGGLGIGLTLARSMVELHGGTIRAHSEGRGRGTDVVITLPTAPAPELAAPSAHVPQRTAKVARRVLVVDDNVDSVETLGLLLESLGADVQTATDGAQALERIQSHRPDLVILDIGMPRMDGHEVARRARAMPEGKTVTLVALTGWGQEEDRRRTKEAGFDEHLVKPVELDALQRLLVSRPARATD